MEGLYSYDSQLREQAKYRESENHKQINMDGQNYEKQLREEAMQVKYAKPIRERTVMLEELLNYYTVEELQTAIYDEVHRDCEGCKVNHPSQMKHMLCLFTSTDDWVEFYIDTAFKKVNLYKVMSLWYPELQRMQLSDNEKVKAYQMWTDIKEGWEHNRSDLQEEWISVWAERVIKAWNHGHH